jgi:hypothetical protein
MPAASNDRKQGFLTLARAESAQHADLARIALEAELREALRQVCQAAIKAAE